MISKSKDNNLRTSDMFTADDIARLAQIAGGGRYDCGVGFAIGIDRVIESLAREGNEWNQ